MSEWAKDVHKEISTLIWSEWRRQRKTFFLLLASTVAFYILMAILIQFKLFLREIDVVTSALIIGLPLLYAIVLSDSFSTEFTNKSNSFSPRTGDHLPHLPYGSQERHT